MLIKRISITCLVLFLVACTSKAAPETPTPAPTMAPTTTAMVIPTASRTPLTGLPTPKQTYFLPPSPTKAVAPLKTATPVNQATTYDFRKYGPIAYIDESETATIRLVNPNGSEFDWFVPTDLISVTDLAWSRDGKFIILATTWDGINILSYPEKEIRNLPSTQEFSIILNPPAVSPDGKDILFFAYNEGQIFRISSNGSGLTNLTPDSSYRNSSEFPSWSIDGKQIIFSRRPDGQIYVMKPDGTDSRAITSSGFNEQPIYSPDGRWIAFIRYDPEIVNGYLYIMPAQGGGMQALTSDSFDVTGFSWSPDGKFLLFSDFHCDNTCGPRNYIVDIKNGELVPLQIPHYAGYNLAWSPLMKTALSDGQPNPREDCTNGWSQLKIGGYVNNLGEIPNRIRSAPQKGDNIIGELISGESYFVLDGPVCADGLVFWEIADARLPNGSGWTAEGNQQEYYLEP